MGEIGIMIERCLFRQQKFIRTREDWYPSFRPNQRSLNPEYHNPLPYTALRVSMMQLLELPNKPGAWRVCVWGSDDMGMERDVKTPVTAQKLFNAIHNFTTKDDLIKMRFRHT
jgi:hypothetical protein